MLDFYCIGLKKDLAIKINYGQQRYDFDEGILFFIAPGQVYSIEPQPEADIKPSGWMLFVHPDFLWNTALAKSIKGYEFFDYSVQEALFLSGKEEQIIAAIMQNMQHEYHANIDRFSQDIIITQLELLLNYADRFYHRQFITRKINNHEILDRLETVLSAYFKSDELAEKGIPTVQWVADQLHLSPGYLSAMLRSMTGQNTQQHIHDKLIETAKEKISATSLSISEIAYELGFGHSQSFSKFFRMKTNLSPLEFRQSFN